MHQLHGRRLSKSTQGLVCCVAATFFPIIAKVASLVNKECGNSSESQNPISIYNVKAVFKPDNTAYHNYCFSSSRSTVLASSLVVDLGENQRFKTTAADRYFATHKQLPRPSTMHATLNLEQEHVEEQSRNILVVGDIHGCMEELQMLMKKAIEETNDGHPFAAIILVGDLCNKGPKCAEVIRWARTAKNVFSVRGNHDDGALAAALGDETRRKKRKYNWVLDGEDADTSKEVIRLSDEDVEWLADLPYTFTIPSAYLGPNEDKDTLIVHAGLIPDIELHKQAISTMITVREVLPICNPGTQSLSSFQYHERQKGAPPAEVNPSGITCGVPMPWASVWRGPQRVIFGHDARRGYQRYPGDHAIGLDTGAVYGKSLTGIVLPGKRIVSVSSVAEHSPKHSKPDANTPCLADCVFPMKHRSNEASVQERRNRKILEEVEG